MVNIEDLVEKIPVLEDIIALKPTVWINPKKKLDKEAWSDIDFTEKDIYEADERLKRFAPLLMEYFEDTREMKGIIESPLKRIHSMEGHLRERSNFQGKLFLKMDSHLAVAGSIKARGGIYEVLYYAEKLALENELITF